MIEFCKCTCCGECCRHIDNVRDFIYSNPEFELDFPYEDYNGVCEMLDENGRCVIYDDRPLICNREKLLRYLVNRKQFKVIDFINLNNISCQNLQNGFKLNK
jgi:hypothetical protein